MMSSRNFMDVGQALATIHTGSLYRAEFQSFEDYRRVKWGFARCHPYHLMAAAQISTYLCINGAHRKPDNERQLRPFGAP